VTGLEQLRAAMLHARPQGFADLLGMDVTEVEEGRVVLTATPGREHYNLMGVVHGGFAASLLDSACGLAAVSALRTPANCLTLEVKVAYHAALTDAVGEVRAIGRVLSIGRRTAFTEARLEDGAGKLYASATSTLIIAPKTDGLTSGLPG
jgi:uncharacterized protein (TIGR00369 family)